MKNFFNAIGVADMERVHSAMIAWILDDENDNTLSSTNPSQFTTFSKNERSCLLCELFGVDKKEFQSIKTHVEWYDIDVMIETEDYKDCHEVWVIENKLKSQEHKSNEKDATTGEVKSVWQTEKYKKIIQNYFPDSKFNKHYMLLSLGGDKAKSSGWSSFTYKRLLESLKNVFDLNEHILINEYVCSVDKMMQELDDFLSPKTKLDYTHVFNKLKKSKIGSYKLEEHERYIIENGLETIFQKCFLAEMWKNYITKQYIFYDKDWSISETNGTALLDIRLGEIKLKSGDTHHVQIEFQNGTFKIQFYQINERKEKFLKKWEKIFNGGKSYKDKNNETWKVNYPKPNSNRSYISISKKIDNNWWEKDRGNILEQWKKNLQKCKNALDQIIEDFKNQNN